MTPVSRAQFLRGDWQGRKPDLKPPWALAEPAFSNACDACGKCVSACDEQIVFISRSGIPSLNFAKGGCTFCGECSAVCETGALLRTHEPGELPWGLQAEISESCLAKRGTSCVRCIEECEYDAIVATPLLGGRTRLQVDTTVCTGCGMCVATCPTNVISLNNPA
jgi:ferredoxin-type protein NapF